MANWETERYVPACSSHFSNYIRDVDFSPDGSYFVVATTGATAIAFGGTPLSGPLCDSSARWETSATGTALQPTWVDHTGGDTNYSVAITGTAVYLGGHQRWQNNYWGSDSLRPGGVRRAGIAAVSPLNGIPFSWNPTRVRGLGAQALLATTDGLYVGSDTDTIGHEYHAKIALMPVARRRAGPGREPGHAPRRALHRGAGRHDGRAVVQRELVRLPRHADRPQLVEHQGGVHAQRLALFGLERWAPLSPHAQGRRGR